jgi:hypothetical protein
MVIALLFQGSSSDLKWAAADAHGQRSSAEACFSRVARRTTGTEITFGKVTSAFSSVLKLLSPRQRKKASFVLDFDGSKEHGFVNQEKIDGSKLWCSGFGAILESSHQRIFSLLFPEVEDQQSVLRAYELPDLTPKARRELRDKLGLKCQECFGILVREWRKIEEQWQEGMEVIRSKFHLNERVNLEIDTKWAKYCDESLWLQDKSWLEPRRRWFAEFGAQMTLFHREHQIMVRIRIIFKVLMQDYTIDSSDIRCFARKQLDKDTREFIEDILKSGNSMGSGRTLSSHLELFLANLADLQAIFFVLCCANKSQQELGDFPVINTDSQDHVVHPTNMCPEKFRDYRIEINDLAVAGTYLRIKDSKIPHLGEEALYRNIITQANKAELEATNRRPGSGGIDWATFVEVMLLGMQNGQLLLPLPKAITAFALRHVQQRQAESDAARRDAAHVQSYYDEGIHQECLEALGSACLVSGVLQDGTCFRVLQGNSDFSNDSVHTRQMDNSDMQGSDGSPLDSRDSDRGGRTTKRLKEQHFKPVGIANIGNSCYQAVILQASLLSYCCCFFSFCRQICHKIHHASI